ncbi:MAG: hypothetical protein ACK57P_11535, partial [Planctomycetota bacterium]
MNAAEQEIRFAETTEKRFIRFLVHEAVELDAKSLASIGGLDVILNAPDAVANPADESLKI